MYIYIIASSYPSYLFTTELFPKLYDTIHSFQFGSILEFVN